MISKFLKFPLALAMIAVLLVACNQDDNPQPETPQNATITSQIQSLVVNDSTDCYEIVFPITFVYEDGSTQTANSEEDMIALFENIDEDNLPVNVGYPVNLEDPATGEAVTAANEDELETYLAGCEFDDEWDDDDDWEVNPCDSIDFNFGQLGCYNFVFPVGFVLEDGTTVTAQSVDDLEGIFDVDNAPEDFVYPITLEGVDDGETHTANNEDELGQLLEACFDFGGPGDWEDSVVYPVTFISVADDSLGNDNCYTYVYPVSLLTEDGETITTNSDEEILSAIFENGEIDDFVYPFQVINNEDGTTITVNNEDEAEDLIENCD